MDWPEARARLAAPMFAPLHLALARLAADRWPTVGELTALADGVATTTGKALRFVAPTDLPADRLSYERHIAATGEVPTRPENWHDVFNALCWIAWPRTKGRINAQHVAILEERGAEEERHRGPERDALTLFDECGIVVAASDPALLRHIREFEWKTLFWERRDAAQAGLTFLAFGHATLEQALAPYIGMVSKTVFVPVDPLFHMLPVEVQVPRADELAARFFESRLRFASPKSLAPLPVLGVPGWHFAAQDEAFYADQKYFRPKQRPGTDPDLGR